MEILLVGADSDRLIRMRKRIRCAASALAIAVSIRQERDDLRALEWGALKGPIAIARSGDGREHVLMDGLEPVETIQNRLLRWLSDQRGSGQDTRGGCQLNDE